MIIGINAKNANQLRGTEVGTTYKLRRSAKKLMFGGSTKLRTNTFHRVRIPLISPSLDRFNNRVVTAIRATGVVETAGIIYERYHPNFFFINNYLFRVY